VFSFRRVDLGQNDTEFLETKAFGVLERVRLGEIERMEGKFFKNYSGETHKSNSGVFVLGTFCVLFVFYI
jgi:hypothetical protein